MGHPSFGKAVPCSCQRRGDDPSRVARLQRYSNMGPLTRSTFQVTRPEGKSAKAEDQELFRQGYEMATAYAEDPRGWLVLTGPSASGKTHLAAAIANSVLGRGLAVFFVFVPDLLDHLRSAFAPSSDVSFDQLFEQVRSAPFLVLDDLGGHSSTPWAQEKLYQILNFQTTPTKCLPCSRWAHSDRGTGESAGRRGWQTLRWQPYAHWAYRSAAGCRVR